jgi:hypothetical protein
MVSDDDSLDVQPNPKTKAKPAAQRPRPKPVTKNSQRDKGSSTQKSIRNGKVLFLYGLYILSFSIIYVADQRDLATASDNDKTPSTRRKVQTNHISKFLYLFLLWLCIY